MLSHVGKSILNEGFNFDEIYTVYQIFKTKDIDDIRMVLKTIN